MVGRFSKNISKINTISKLLKILDNKEEAEDLILELDPQKEVVLELRKGGKLGKSRIVKLKPELK